MLYNISHVSLINVTDGIVSVMTLYASHVSLISMTDDIVYDIVCQSCFID